MAEAIIPPRMPISDEPAERRPTPRIAVVIPCFNEEVTITDVVEQFRRELPDAVICVFDNNSTDGTVRARATGRRAGASGSAGPQTLCRAIDYQVQMLSDQLRRERPAADEDWR